MAAVVLKNETLKSLKGKVVVISGLHPSIPTSIFVSNINVGSARGIGAETVQTLHAHGAVVIHGDWDEIGGTQLDVKIRESRVHPAPVQFVKTDVTNYESLLNLFETAWTMFRRVDIAISNAGLQEAGDWFDPRLDIESVKIVRSDSVHYGL
jgi:NAD(P)-dependent dehydrogenase (short-subunit alcohol dehydrogenase family)